MRYLALCTDYDGTLAEHGAVSPETIAALERLRASGRKTFLVTGRQLDDLQTVFSRLDLFDYVVAENGALLYRPETREEKVLAERPPARFVEALQARGVSPVSVGRVIVATWEPHQNAVLETIHDMGLELQLIFNKGAVMILPPGVNKASGLAVALEMVNLSPHSAVAIGDAENDHALLSLCECGVATANALPGLMAMADFVTAGDHGKGVTELIDELLRDDLSAREKDIARHRVLLGRDEAGADVSLRPYGGGTLVVGTSGSGKSTIAISLLERLNEQAYTYCVIDPEGDYDGLEHAIKLGTPDRAPSIEEVVQLLQKPNSNAVINLVGLPFEDRPKFFQALLPHLQTIRASSGRPHWLLMDEVHHMLPAELSASEMITAECCRNSLMISVHPRLIAQQVLSGVDTVIAVGKEPNVMLQEFALTLGDAVPDMRSVTLSPGDVLVWNRKDGQMPMRVKTISCRTEHHRHIRKYSEGELPEDRSFYFRGPQNKLNLRAQNLILFMQLADGVDDETWRYHLQRGDVSDWIKHMIKDEDLAGEIHDIETSYNLDANASRSAVRHAIEKNYTLPATPPARMLNA